MCFNQRVRNVKRNVAEIFTVLVEVCETPEVWKSRFGVLMQLVVIWLALIKIATSKLAFGDMRANAAGYSCTTGRMLMVSGHHEIA